MKNGEKGFTFIELIITAGVTVLVAGAASIASMQIFKQSELHSNHMTAVGQAQNAGLWITRDTQMAENITAENLTQPDFLLVNWEEEGSGDLYQIIYTLEDMPAGGMKKLERNMSVNGTDNMTTYIAQHIDPDNQKTNCQFANGTVNLTITATVGSGSKQQSETRTYQIVPRRS